MMKVKYYRFFFFNDTATTEIYTLSLHDALPISQAKQRWARGGRSPTSPVGTTRSRSKWHATTIATAAGGPPRTPGRDRKSTRLNSSHANISYAVFCLKKKKVT